MECTRQKGIKAALEEQNSGQLYLQEDEAHARSFKTEGSASGDYDWTPTEKANSTLLSALLAHLRWQQAASKKVIRQLALAPVVACDPNIWAALDSRLRSIRVVCRRRGADD
jgi:hypothetical protein